jgi:hypothetical protein
LVLTSTAALVVDAGLVLAGVDVAGVEALAGGELAAVVALLVVLLLPQPAASRATAAVMLHRARGRFT